MEKITNRCKSLFIWALTLSILAVAGIPMIVLGAVNALWAVMVLGIVFVVAGVYVMPFLWVKFGESKGVKRMVFAVEKEYVYSVKDLAMRFGMSEKAVVGSIRTCIEKGYLIGYLFDGNEIKANTNKPINDRVITVRCENCGATYSYDVDKKGKCPYCGGTNADN